MAIAPEDVGTRAADVLARVEEENVEFIRFWFTDIFGQLKSFAVGREELAGALEDGMGFDGSSITGFNRIEESDMIAMPDPSTFRILPWRTGETHKVGRLFCDVLKPGGEPYEGDPRFQMRRALARAQDMGFDHYYLGPELEFFLFKSDKAPEVLDRGGYFDLTTLDVGSDFRRDAVFTLRELGIPVEYTHHEVGPSQHEIDMRFADGLDMADNAMTYRIAIKEVAAQHGFYATFMPKPLHGENGSGMHTHQSLFRGGDNAFFDPDDEFYLSDVAKSFIAGQLHHARDLAALFAPSVNSYKRLERGYELPDPIERNLYDLTEDERRAMGVQHLPESLGEAIEEMAGSELVERALGSHIFERYIALKRDEWLDYRTQVTPWELDRYLPIT